MDLRPEVNTDIDYHIGTSCNDGILYENHKL